MALGEKLFEEIGTVMGVGVRSVHPVEGITMEVSFTAETKGIGRFPSGTNVGTGTTTQYPHGIRDGKYHGIITTTQGEQYSWWSHEKSRLTLGGKTKGIIIVTGFTASQTLSWMNSLVMVLESEFDPLTQAYRSTAYEWM
jgi:hypothetical protein